MNSLTVALDRPIIPSMTTWLTCTEAAEKTGYAARYLQRLCRQGKLACVVKGKTYLIDPSDLTQYVRRMQSLGTARHDPTGRASERRD